MSGPTYTCLGLLVLVGLGLFAYPDAGTDGLSATIFVIGFAAFIALIAVVFYCTAHMTGWPV